MIALRPYHLDATMRPLSRQSPIALRSSSGKEGSIEEERGDGEQQEMTEKQTKADCLSFSFGRVSEIRQTEEVRSRRASIRKEVCKEMGNGRYNDGRGLAA